MSVLTDVSLLDYLHDAQCISFSWDCTDPSVRRVRLVVNVDEDSEYEPWKGRMIALDLFDVVMCRFVGWGYQIGDERIDAYREGVSAEFDLECSRLHNLGIDIPPLIFTIVLGSGSTIEIACREVAVSCSG